MHSPSPRSRTLRDHRTTGPEPGGPARADASCRQNGPERGPVRPTQDRILNGAHTALVVRTQGGPWDLVREAMADPGLAAWLEQMLREEVVPALGDRIEDGQAFVTDVLERFRIAS